MNHVLWILLLATSPLISEEKPSEKSKRDAALEKELLSRVKVDQELRFKMIDLMQKLQSDTNATQEKKQADFNTVGKQLQETDVSNTKWLKGVVEKHGWPTYTLVGKEGADAAWLLCQHADADPKFQRLSLDLMSKLPKTEITLANLAYLTDRVLLAEGKKQIYGTQFMEIDGKMQPRDLDDPKQVDKRRAEMGMPSLDVYRKQMEEIYGKKPKK